MADFFLGKSSSSVAQGPVAGRPTVLSVELYLSKRHQTLTLISRLTFGMNVTVVALMGSSVPKIYQVMLPVPVVALTSVMACNVQRSLLTEGQATEAGTIASLGLSFTDVINFLTRSHKSEKDDGHVGVQNNISEVKTMPTDMTV